MEELATIPISKTRGFNSFSSKQNYFMSSYSTKQFSIKSSLIFINQFKHSQSNQSLQEIKCCFKNQLISRKIGLGAGYKVKRLNLTLLKPKTIDPKVIASPISFDYQIEKNTNSNFNNKYNFILKKPKTKTRDSCSCWNVNISSSPKSNCYKTILGRRKMKGDNSNYENNYNVNCNDNIYDGFERNYDKTLLNSKKHITVSLLQK